MADNLAFSVSADTSKARADLKLLQAEMQNVGRQLNAAVKAGDTTGARALADTFGVMAANVAGLKKEINGTSVAMTGLGRSTALTQRSFRSFEGALFSIGKSLGGLQAGLVAFAAFTGFEALIKQLDAVDERLRKIRDTAREIGQKPLVTQAAEEIAGRTGEKPEDADKILGGVGGALEKAAGTAIDSVRVLRGGMNDAANAAKNLGSEILGGVTILRGSSPVVLDLANAYKTIGVNLADYRGRANGAKEATLATARAFLDMQKSLNPAQLNALSKALFQGLPADAALKILPALIKDLEAQTKALATTERGATDQRLEDISKLDAARNRLTNAWVEMDAKFGNSLRQFRTDNTNALAEFLETTLPNFTSGMSTAFDAWYARTKEAFATFWADLEKDFAEGMARWAEHLPDFSSWIESTKAMFASLWDSITSTASRVANAVGATLSTTRAAPTFASGGYIRGPGTGTSDSILARLSNGEFVMRAAAVDAWGPRFMMALNNLRNPFGYAGGGLVRPPRFATGGMVTATTSDGVTVNLNFPGSSFALRGDREIVGGLTREARRAGMLSAGKMAGALA